MGGFAFKIGANRALQTVLECAYRRIAGCHGLQVLEQKFAFELMLQETQERVATGKRDGSEFFEGQLEESLKLALLRRQ